MNNFTRPGAIATRDCDTRRAHSYVSAIRRRLSSYVRQGAGRPSTGSTGATMSIFLGLDSEARELRVELGGHSFIPRNDRPQSQRYVKDHVSGGLRHFQSRRRRLSLNHIR